MSARILVVDDNLDIMANVRDYLSLRPGWTVETSPTGGDALQRLTSASYDLLILDIGLPGIDGLSVTKTLRESGSRLPILMLTARDTVDDRVEGLMNGADDYLIKPFSLRELAARAEALLRRANGASADELTVGPLTLNLKTMAVTREGTTIRLNPTCLQLLRELMQKSPAVVGRNRLETVVWNGSPPSSDSLRSNLYLLRQAVDKPFDTPLIRTHPGLGWSIAEPR